MKALHRSPLTLAILLLFLLSCSPTKNVPAPSVTERDGATQQNAILIKSVSAEYEWVRTNYPGSQVTGQALISSGGKHYDVLTLVTQAGETKKVYFDITSFFGKF